MNKTHLAVRAAAALSMSAITTLPATAVAQIAKPDAAATIKDAEKRQDSCFKKAFKDGAASDNTRAREVYSYAVVNDISCGIVRERDQEGYAKSMEFATKDGQGFVSNGKVWLLRLDQPVATYSDNFSGRMDEARIGLAGIQTPGAPTRLKIKVSHVFCNMVKAYCPTSASTNKAPQPGTNPRAPVHRPLKARTQNIEIK